MFYWSLLAVSVVPYVLLPIAHLGGPSPNVETVRQTILFLANAHIAITAYFYWDPGFRNIIREHPKRYVLFPVAAVLLAGASYAAIPDSYTIAWWIIYGAWQNWHFGKQTFGVYALVSLDHQPPQRVAPIERALLYITVAAGSLGIMWTLGGDDAIKRYTLLIRDLCGYVTFATFTVAIVYIIATRMRPRRAAFLAFSLLFFAPQYLISQGPLAVIAYSVAHSFQYLLIMSMVAFNAQTEEEGDNGVDAKLVIALVFFTIMLVGGSVLTIRDEFGSMLRGLTGSELLGKFLVGASFGLVVAHFIIDAHAWRLRDAPQRAYVMQRLRFIGRRVLPRGQGATAEVKGG